MVGKNRSEQPMGRRFTGLIGQERNILLCNHNDKTHSWKRPDPYSDHPNEKAGNLLTSIKGFLLFTWL